MVFDGLVDAEQPSEPTGSANKLRDWTGGVKHHVGAAGTVVAAGPRHAKPKAVAVGFDIDTQGKAVPRRDDAVPRLVERSQVPLIDRCHRWSPHQTGIV